MTPSTASCGSEWRCRGRPADVRIRRRIAPNGTCVQPRTGRACDTSALPCSAVITVLASITDPIVNFAVDVVGELGLPGVFLLMTLESACIPVPSEATMLFAGFNVAEGEYSLWAAVLVGSFANLVGSWIAYAVGYYGRVDILEKHGKKLHIKKSHLEWADRWFERHGDATVFFSR